MNIVRKLFLCIALASLAAGMALPPGARAEMVEDGSADYVLGPHDVLNISVFGQPDLGLTVRIRASGRITFPILEEVTLGGLSVREAEEHLGERLDEEGMAGPGDVTIFVQSYQSKQVSVLGAVGRPGAYPLDRALEISDLIAIAGGRRVDASDYAMFLRRNDDGRLGRLERIDLKALFEDGAFEQNVALAPGDVLHVPSEPTFYIYGSIRQPGRFPLERDMTVRKAMTLAGWTDEFGRESGIRIHRKDGDGEVTEIDVTLADMLQDGDVIYVPESWF